MSQSFRCSDATARRCDPRYATAPLAQQWLLLEHPGPWGRQILAEAGLDPGLADALGRWAAQAGSRVQLIRRPGPRRCPGQPRRWCWADARPGREQVRWGTFTAEAELLDVLGDPRAAGAPSAEPVYLVCTHGTHDMCCALRGRPVAAALAVDHPEHTWECSHVGGHRFAANLVLLPHGLYHGQVPPAAAGQVVAAYERGRLSLEWLRGRSSLPAPVQAAQHFVRTATGETGVASCPLSTCESTGADEWTVRLIGPDDQLVTVLVQARTELTAEPLSCSATGPGQSVVFEARSACYAFGPPAT